MSYAKQAVAKNTLIQIGGKAFSTLLGLAAFALLWRMLGPDAYGTLTIALTFLAVIATFVDFGLTLTTVQLISEQHEREEAILGNLLSLRLISAGICLGVAPIAALLFPYDGIVIALIAIGVFSYYSASVSQMLGGIFQRQLAMEKPMLAEIFNRLCVMVGVGTVWLSGGGLLAIMWVFVLGNIVQLVTIILFATRYIRLKPQISWPVWKLILERTWPIGASIFFNLIYLKGDIVFLSIYRGAFEIGLYSTAYKIIEVIAAIPVMYMGLVLPILVSAWTKGEKGRFSHALQDAFDFFTILAFPCAFGLALVGREAIVFVAGEAFAEAGPVLWVLGPALLFVFYGALFGHAIVGLNKQRVMTWAYVAVAILTIAGYLIHIPQYGMWGAAFWTLISEALITLIAGVVVIYVSGTSLRLHMLAKSIVATTCMALVILFIPLPHVLLKIALGSIIYGAILALIGGPTPRALSRLLLAKSI